MKTLRILALALAAMLLVGMLPAFAEGGEGEALPYWIGIDVNNQRLTVYSTADNRVVHRWRCSTGRSVTPTPTGVYKIPTRRNTRREWYKFGNVYVKWATRVTGGIYMHSVLFNRADDSSLIKSSLNKLGHKASHGCIRLEVCNARWISDHIANGTKVVIHKGVNDSRIKSALGGPAGTSITPSAPMPPKVKSLALDQAGPITLKKGETLQLHCTVSPADAPTSLKWKSSKKKNVTVSSSGLVTAVGDGAATVTVTASNGVKASVKVTSVDPSAARSVTLDRQGTITVNVGETLQLNATVAPENATAKLTWKSGKPRFATVSGSGLVTGIAKGTTKITVTTPNKKKAVVTVKVLDPNPPSKVQLKEKGPRVLRVGETLQLNAVLTPGTAKTTYAWTSSKKGVAKVDGKGLVTAVKKGRTKITVKTANKKKATIIIQVVD